MSLCRRLKPGWDDGVTAFLQVFTYTWRVAGGKMHGGVVTIRMYVDQMTDQSSALLICLNSLDE